MDVYILLLTAGLQLLTRFLAILITAAAANYWVLPPAAVVIVVFLVLRWYYLKTARDVKRLEAIGKRLSFLLDSTDTLILLTFVHVARSPLYSHISMTLQGLPTIRTFGKQDIAVSQLFTYQNQHSQVILLSHYYRS